MMPKRADHPPGEGNQHSGVNRVSSVTPTDNLRPQQPNESELERRILEATALNEMSRRVSASLSLDDVARAALEGIGPPVNSDLALLFLRQGEDLIMQAILARDPNARHESTPVHRVGECLCGLAAQTGEATYALDVRNDPRCTWEECREAGIISFAALPLRAGGRVLGVLGLASTRAEVDYGKWATFLETLSNEVAIGFQNALLFEEAKRSAAEVAKANEELRTEIAERGRAEHALQEAARQWQDTFDAVGDAIWLLDAECRIVRCNNATVRIFGKQPAEVVGRYCWEMAHGTSEPPRDCPVMRMKRTRHRETTELQSGDRWLEVVVDPILDGAGNVGGAVHVVTDITDRKRAEQQLRQSEASLRSIYTAAPIMIGIVEGRTLLHANDRMWELTGYAPEDRIGADSRELYLNQAEYDRVGRELYEGLVERGRSSVETHWRCKNGRVIDILLSVAPLRGENASNQSAFTALDMTEWKQAERERLALMAQLHQAQKLEAIGQLASGMAHDFGNLTTVILGNVELLREQLAETGSEGSSLEMVEKAARDAASVTRSLLTFTRQAPTEKRLINLVDCVNHSVTLLRRLLPKSIEVTVSGPTEPPILITADATQIQQVLMNLIINARDSMPSGGTLTISVRIGRADEWPHPGDDWWPARPVAVIEVTDTGCGMSPAVCSRVFEPFFTTKERGKGTGLGLAIVQSIIQDHGGRVEVRSRVGSGTTFSVILPCPEFCGPVVRPGGDADPAQEQRPVILVSLRDPHVHALISASLRSAHYAVIDVTEPAKLPETLQREAGAYALLILDRRAQDNATIDLLRALRERGAQTPAILLTDPVTPSFEESLPPDTFLLPAPFKMTELLRLVTATCAPGRRPKP